MQRLIAMSHLRDLHRRQVDTSDLIENGSKNAIELSPGEKTSARYLTVILVNELSIHVYGTITTMPDCVCLQVARKTLN